MRLTINRRRVLNAGRLGERYHVYRFFWDFRVVGKKRRRGLRSGRRRRRNRSLVEGSGFSSIPVAIDWECKLFKNLFPSFSLSHSFLRYSLHLPHRRPGGVDVESSDPLLPPFLLLLLFITLHTIPIFHTFTRSSSVPCITSSVSVFYNTIRRMLSNSKLVIDASNRRNVQMEAQVFGGRDRTVRVKRPEYASSFLPSFFVSLYVFVWRGPHDNRSLFALRCQGIEIDEMTQRC